MLTVNPSRKVLDKGREEGAVEEIRVSIYMIDYMAMATAIPELPHTLRTHASLEDASPYGRFHEFQEDFLSRVSRKLRKYHKNHICIQCALRFNLTLQEISSFQEASYLVC